MFIEKLTQGYSLSWRDNEVEESEDKGKAPHPSAGDLEPDILLQLRHPFVSRFPAILVVMALVESHTPNW